ncbi:MAG TPA: hypothetical protein VNU01_04350 [Egibacteraceae bacterium]|nr:hypothetical protein [Egibacteraceae bacterium]
MDTGDGELPVAVELPAGLELDVTLFVEREAGWRRVPLEGPPSPALLLTQRARTWPPSVVVLPGPVDAATVRRALLEGALDVIAWPEDRERLAACAGRLPAGPSAPAPLVLSVVAASGGVGASTVALALAGLVAWGGRRVAITGGEGMLRLAGLSPWRGPGADELARLAPGEALREFPRVAHAVPGVRGLWALHASGSPAAHGWPVEVLVVDGAVTGPAPAHGAVLAVARADAGLERLAGAAVPVVVNGAGPRSAAQVRRILGREPLAWLPHSARVARAACAGRVPAGLPASWLSPLRRAVGRLS